jgi:hypothetical protein
MNRQVVVFGDQKVAAHIVEPVRFQKGDEVIYVGQERTPREEPFASATEIWVESADALQAEDDIYLFSCRLKNGRWEMGQQGYGRHFRLRRP